MEPTLSLMRDDAARGGSSVIKDQLACVGGSGEVAGSIGNTCFEGVSAIGGERFRNRRSEAPAATGNGGIAKEGVAGIDAQGVTGGKSSGKCS